jgi:hypothetical protein
LRKRLSRESCDSPLRKFTEANEITCLPGQRIKKYIKKDNTIKQHTRGENPARDM